MSASPKYRFFLAYRTAGLLFFSYLWLWFLKRLFGTERLSKRIYRTHEKNGRRLLKTLLHLQGLFIKVGQMISIMTTFLPEPITQKLEGLQDSVPARPYEDIEKRFLEEFQKKPLEVFSSFNPIPIASASLGQVHEARLSDQTRVAVKVQYPEIEEIVQKDLKILKRIFGLLNLFFPHYGFSQTYREIRTVVVQELNFITEGKNLETLQAHFKEEPDFLFSKVYWEYSTERILTLEFMEGIKISNRDQLTSTGIDLTQIATKIIHAYCKQIFIDGIYHADPHPGNFLVQPFPSLSEGNAAPFKIIPMDFGAVARISDRMRQGAAKFIEGIIRQDNRIISQAMKDMGFIAKTENEEVFDRIVEFFYDHLKEVKLEDIQQLQLGQIGGLEDILEFRRLDIGFKDLLHTFNVPKDWALMERALLLLFGLTSHLDPTLNPLTIIIPYAEQFVLGKDKKLGDALLEAGKEIGLGYLKLPHELLKVLKKLNQGEIEIKLKANTASAEKTAQALNRLTLALVALGLAFLGCALEALKIDTALYAFYAGGFFGLWWMVSFLFL